MRSIVQTISVALLTLIIGAPLAAAQSDEADRIKESVVVITEILTAPDKGVPAGVLSKAEGVAVFPGTVKGAFIFGAQHGRGVLSVRDRARDTWSAPAFLSLDGGSFGAQIGGQAVDIVLVIMNRRGLENLLQNRFKIGAEGSVAAGPVGREAEAATDLQMRAEMLSYSRARGLFAGVGHDIDDGAGASGAHAGQEGLDAVIGPVEVGIDHGPIILEGEHLEGAARGVGAGGIHQHFHLAEAGQNPARGILHSIGIADVAREDLELRAVGAGQLDRLELLARDLTRLEAIARLVLERLRVVRPLPRRPLVRQVTLHGFAEPIDDRVGLYHGRRRERARPQQQ